MIAEVIITLSAMWATLIVSLLLPFLNSLATKFSASNLLKILFSALTSFVSAVVIESLAADGSLVLEESTVIRFATIFGIQMLAYLGLYKPLDIPEKLAPSKGLG